MGYIRTLWRKTCLRDSTFDGKVRRSSSSKEGVDPSRPYLPTSGSRTWRRQEDGTSCTSTPMARNSRSELDNLQWTVMLSLAEPCSSFRYNKIEFLYDLS